MNNQRRAAMQGILRLKTTMSLIPRQYNLMPQSYPGREGTRLTALKINSCSTRSVESPTHGLLH